MQYTMVTILVGAYSIGGIMESIAQLMNLEGKVAIVTGGALGIGEAISMRLAEAGASVLIADINIEAAKRTAGNIVEKGGKAEAVKTDVSNANDTQQLIKAAVSTFGGIDILVNNAGIYPPSPAVNMSEAQWDKVLAINLKGTFLCAQAAAKEMIKAGGGGKIINLASAGATVPTGMMSHYDASKGGVISFTKSLAKELGQFQITVNAVAPGGVPTESSAAVAAEMIKILNLPKDAVPPPRSVLGRWGSPDDIAKVVCFLSSSMADYMTGSLVSVDGGFLLM